ncbi:MAG TPA: Hsp20/alpha crystallin family protein [Candidatus Binatia bacterium]|nr:Hsp20/alpha crystallin family protein [Candidatus Binatia bacterium]
MAKESRDVARQERQQGGAVTPFRPLAEIARWERDFDRMLENFFRGRFPLSFEDRWSERLGVREPAIDLYEDKDDIVVKAEMPGLSKDDIEVDITDHLLILKGEKKKAEEANERDYYRSERVYGSFVRSIPLPSETDPQKAQATFKNGVLEVRLPKSEEAKKREIKVKIEGEAESGQRRS